MSDIDDDLDKYKPPVEGAGDKTLAIGRNLVSPIAEIFVPGSSGPIAILVDFIKDPYARRHQQWMENISIGLGKLERRNILDDLKTNDEFHSVLIQATLAALRTHQEEKITALRNAVVNTAAGIDISSDLKQLFVRYVDELTPSHITLLRFLSENETKLAQTESFEILFRAFVSENSQPTIERDQFRLLCEDLKARVLVRISPNVNDFDDIYDAVLLESERSGNATDIPLIRVTDMGRQLLSFVTSRQSY